MDPSLAWEPGSGTRRYAVRPFCFSGSFLVSFLFLFLSYFLPHTCRAISAPLVCSFAVQFLGRGTLATGQGESTFVPLAFVRRLATDLHSETTKLCKCRALRTEDETAKMKKRPKKRPK